MSFECIKGCFECCGCIPLPNELWAKHKNNIQKNIKYSEMQINEDEVAVVTSDSICIFLDRETKKCSIYEDRPQVCRDFGSCGALDREHIFLTCPHLRPDGSKWNHKERIYLSKFHKKLERWLSGNCEKSNMY